MNIYKLHTSPKSLDLYQETDQQNAAVIWSRYKSAPEELRKRESALTDSGEIALEYATDILRGPFPAGEAAIAKSPRHAYEYVKNALNPKLNIAIEKGVRFMAGEPAMAKDAAIALKYAMFILGGPFPAGETAIAADAELSYSYAYIVLKRKPFKKGEASIAKDAEIAFKYAKTVLDGEFKAGEAAIGTDARISFNYAYEVLHRRFEAGEKTLATEPGIYKMWYAHEVLKADFHYDGKLIAKF